MFQGYAVGAIDYLLKPIRPAILRSKVLVLMNLHRRTEEVRQLKEELRLKRQEMEDLHLMLKNLQGQPAGAGSPPVEPKRESVK